MSSTFMLALRRLLIIFTREFRWHFRIQLVNFAKIRSRKRIQIIPRSSRTENSHDSENSAEKARGIIILVRKFPG